MKTKPPQDLSIDRHADGPEGYFFVLQMHIAGASTPDKGRLPSHQFLKIKGAFNKAIYELCRREFAKPVFQPLDVQQVWKEIERYL